MTRHAPTIGRAGFDVAHDRATASKSANRRRSLEEAFRDVDPALAQEQAARNPNVDPSRTGENVGFLNDGGGRLVHARTRDDLEKIVQYGDERIGRVRRKIRDDSLVSTRVVFTLPKSMCVPKTWTNDRGEVREYWAARDKKEAMDYFAECARFLGREVLPGGPDAIHGFNVNFDEYTPHAQFQCDTLGEDVTAKAKPGDLAVCASVAWGSHRDVRYQDGPKKGQQVSGPEKLRGYQQAFRNLMADKGYPVDRQPDPDRSRRKLSRADYIEVQESREALEGRQEALEAAQGALEAQQAALDAQRAELVRQQAALDAERDELAAQEEARAQRRAAAQVVNDFDRDPSVSASGINPFEVD